MIVETLIQKGEYRDSVALMQIARKLGSCAGVSNVSVVMGTPANKALLEQAGLLSKEAETAGPNDLVIALGALDETAARDGLAQAQELLAAKAAMVERGAAGARPRTLRSAVRQSPAANVAVISIAGQYAAAQAWDALRAGLSVLLFSDHVELQDEIELKTYARDHSLLLMGPGAGTAFINGIGLGFANAAPHGPVGIVAAAGTGLQEAATLLAKNGLGITQGIGVGGRDVKDSVGGIMMLEGLKALQADPETRVIMIVSKLPSPGVVDRVIAQVEKSLKPTVVAFMGLDLEVTTMPSFAEGQSKIFAGDLNEAATFASAFARGESVDAACEQLAKQDRAIVSAAQQLRRKLNPQQRYLRGLYSGGTLCEETMRLWQETLGGIWSNAPLDPRFQLPDSNKSKQHTVVDLGEEEFTIGKPHPMIDQTLRIQRILQEARDPHAAAIVLDVVLGYGAHPDPAQELAPAIEQAQDIAHRKNRELLFIASVTGTEGDPQGLSRQTGQLEQAGAIVMSSNAAAAKLARAIIC